MSHKCFGNRAAAGGNAAARTAGANSRLLAPVLVVLGVAVWCMSVMAIGVNLAGSAWEWACVFVFGTIAPAFLLWQANRLLNPPEPSGPAPSIEDGRRELLKALAECGEVTPVTAALRTSLSVDEAAAMLDKLAVQSHLELRSEDGAFVYVLRERDRRELLATMKQSWGRECRKEA